MTPTDIQETTRAALELHQAGRLQEAEVLYRQVLAQAPSDAHALHLLGVLSHQTGRHQIAYQLIDRAIRINPQAAFFHNSLGEVCRALGRRKEAIASYRRAIALKPDYPEAHYNLGNGLRDQRLLDEAIACFRRAIEVKADFPEAYVNLGEALQGTGESDLAISAYRQAIGIAPGFAEAYNNLGTLLGDRGELDEAIAACRRAIELKPNYAEALGNLGGLLHGRGEFDDGLRACESAIGRKPDFAEAHWNRALMLLLQGDFERGWAEYEWRWRWKGSGCRPRDFTQPLWDGSPPAGRTLLLHSEQGFGDTIQFIRYAPLLARQGARVVVECQPELRSLLRGVEGVQHLLAQGEPLPPFDLHAPLLSLPLAFGTRLGSIPAQVPYLKADPALAEAWRGKVAGDGRRLKIGLAWAGSPARKGDRQRSVSLSALAPLAAVKGADFYSLQKGPAAEQAKNPPPEMRLMDLTAELKDFADTAALIASLDLVISVDTAVAHLAGAMARPVWTLLEFVPAWRWLLDREDSPWYPTMRLFRQPSRGDWGSVVRRVAEALAARRKS